MAYRRYSDDVQTSSGRRAAWVNSLLADHAVFRLFWSNLAVLVPGRVYRSNHPTPARVEKVARLLGIRTLVNLRGQTNNGSDALSRAAAHRLGIGYLDVPMKSTRAPSRAEVLALIAALTSAEEPMLIHCKSGADRTGFAAGVYLILQGGTADDAQRQLTLRHGHLRRSRAGILNAFFSRFRAEAEGRLDLAEWVRTEYDPAALQAGPDTSRTARLVNDYLLQRE